MDDEQSLLDEPEPEGTAIAAFERVEARIAAMDGRLAVLARAVEHLATEQRADEQPDYGATLTAMADQLTGLRKALDRTSQSPLLSLTPEIYSGELDIAAEQARKADALTIREARTAFEKALVDIAHHRGTARSVADQRRELKRSVIGGALSTVILLGLLTVAIVRGLPRSWGVSEYVATWALNEPNSWDAGRRLMHANDPEAWASLVSAAEIWRDNRGAIAKCRKDAQPGRTKKCALQITG